MVRMKNKINQVVVGNDHMNPLDCEVISVWKSKDSTKGKVRLGGKKCAVTYIGGDVWVLNDGIRIGSILPDVALGKG